MKSGTHEVASGVAGGGVIFESWLLVAYVDGEHLRL